MKCLLLWPNVQENMMKCPCVQLVPSLCFSPLSWSGMESLVTLSFIFETCKIIPMDFSKLKTLLHHRHSNKKCNLMFSGVSLQLIWYKHHLQMKEHVCYCRCVAVLPKHTEHWAHKIHRGIKPNPNLTRRRSLSEPGNGFNVNFLITARFRNIVGKNEDRKVIKHLVN